MRRIVSFIIFCLVGFTGLCLNCFINSNQTKLPYLEAAITASVISSLAALIADKPIFLQVRDLIVLISPAVSIVHFPGVKTLECGFLLAFIIPPFSVAATISSFSLLYISSKYGILPKKRTVEDPTALIRARRKAERRAEKRANRSRRKIK